MFPTRPSVPKIRPVNRSVLRWCFLLLALLSGSGMMTPPRGAAGPEEAPGLYADVETPRGAFTAELFFARAPLTTLAFVGLAEGTLPTTEGAPLGKPFFDGLTFHRVVPGFVVQGGDPRGDGEGGPGFAVPDEFVPGLRHDRAGMLSMANDGADTNGSQFFVTLAPSDRLNYLHPVFGRVVAGGDVLARIAQGDRIERVTIRRVGAAAEAFRGTPERFAELKTAVVNARRPGAASAAGVFTHFKDTTGKLPETRVRNFDLKLANYERTTGHRIVVRVLEGAVKSSPATVATRAVAAELGLEDAGDHALACLFVGSGVWKLRLGEKTFPGLLRTRGTFVEVMRERRMRAAKDAYAAPAEALAAEGKLKESCDAVIDALILGLDREAESPPLLPAPAAPGPAADGTPPKG